MKNVPVLSQLYGDCPPDLRQKATYVVNEANQLIFVDLNNSDADTLVDKLPEPHLCRVVRVQRAILSGALSILLLPIAFSQRLPHKRHVDTVLLPMQKRIVAFASGFGSGDLLKSVLHATEVIKETVLELCNTPRDMFSAWAGLRPWYQRKCVLIQTDASYCPAILSAMEAADHTLSFVHTLGCKRSSSVLPPNATHVCVLHTESADERLYELIIQIKAMPPVQRPTVVFFGSITMNGPHVRCGSVPRNIFKQLVAAVPQECRVDNESPDFCYIPEVGLHYWLSDTIMKCNNPNVMQCSGPLTIEYVREVLSAAMACNPFSTRNIVLLFEDEDVGKAWMKRYLKNTQEKVYLWNCATQRLQQRNRRKSELLCVDGRCWLGLPPHMADTTVVVCSGRIPQTHIAAAVARTKEVCWVITEK